MGFLRACRRGRRCQLAWRLPAARQLVGVARPLTFLRLLAVGSRSLSLVADFVEFGFSNPHLARSVSNFAVTGGQVRVFGVLRFGWILGWWWH